MFLISWCSCLCPPLPGVKWRMKMLLEQRIIYLMYFRHCCFDCIFEWSALPVLMKIPILNIFVVIIVQFMYLTEFLFRKKLLLLLHTIAQEVPVFGLTLRKYNLLPCKLLQWNRMVMFWVKLLIEMKRLLKQCEKREFPLNVPWNLIWRFIID